MDPMLDVVHVDEAVVCAARKAAVFVADHHRAP
jgi:hypothetical protein